MNETSPPPVVTNLEGLLIHPESGVVADLEDTGERRILIVDDETGIRDLYAHWLSEEYECKTAASADEALACLISKPYAIVLADMMMPGRNGVELLRDITSRYPETAVIMVSGVDRPQRVRDALRLGAFDYIIKPCELEVLTLTVERALARLDLQRTARNYKTSLEIQNIELAKRKEELERLQAQLVHTEKMASLGQLAAGIAHELNNPAGFVYGNMDLLQSHLTALQELLAAYDQLVLPVENTPAINSVKTRIGYDRLLGELDSIIADCREGSERICDVVKNLRLFSRLDEAEFKQIEIHGGIDSTIRLLSRYFSSGQILVKRDYGTLPLVTCYAGQLNEVWMNLLANAAQAIEKKGEVKVSTRAEGESVIIEIGDTGKGIQAEHLTRIFDPFFTTKPVGEGTGLGLSVTYGIIEQHGGTISVESERGRGTTFTVKLPIEATKQVSAESSEVPVGVN